MDRNWRRTGIGWPVGRWRLLPDRETFERLLILRLVGAGKIERSGADRAVRLRGAGKEPLERIVTRLGLVHERDVAEAMSCELGIALALAADFPEAPVLEAASARFL